MIVKVECICVIYSFWYYCMLFLFVKNNNSTIHAKSDLIMHCEFLNEQRLQVKLYTSCCVNQFKSNWWNHVWQLELMYHIEKFVFRYQFTINIYIYWLNGYGDIIIGNDDSENIKVSHQKGFFGYRVLHLYLSFIIRVSHCRTCSHLISTKGCSSELLRPFCCFW